MIKTIGNQMRLIPASHILMAFFNLDSEDMELEKPLFRTISGSDSGVGNFCL